MTILLNSGFILKGLIIGFSIAAPVGPIGILCIKRSLSNGKLSGLSSGMGAATADAVYGFVAAFGLMSISNFLIHQRIWIQAGGLIFLLYIGVKIFFEKPQKILSGNSAKKSLAKDYLSTLMLTITNPMTIVSFAAIFAGVGLGNVDTYFSGSLLVFGVFLGSGTWWIILSHVAGVFKNNLNETHLRLTNRISGIIITIFALAIAANLFKFKN